MGIAAEAAEICNVLTVDGPSCKWSRQWNRHVVFFSWALLQDRWSSRGTTSSVSLYREDPNSLLSCIHYAVFRVSLSVYRQFFVTFVMIIYLIMSHTWIIIVNRFTFGETYSSALRCVCAISQISRRSVQHKYPCFPAVLLSSSLFSVPLKGWNFSVDESAMGDIAAEPPNNMSGPSKDLYVVKLTPTIKGQGTSAPKIFTPVISMLQLKLLNLAVTTDVYIYSSGYRTGHGC